MSQNETVDTTVITLDPHDYGSGSTDRIVFHDCKYRVDDHGTLNIFPADGTGGNVATFAPGAWASVIRGAVVAIGNSHPGTSRHELKAVQS